MNLKYLLIMVCLLSIGGNALKAQNTITVTNANDSGAGSLRQAIEDMNESGAAAKILVSPDLSGQTIVLASALPAITQNLVLEGNGITISGDGKHRLLFIDHADVACFRVHFTKGYSDRNYLLGSGQSGDPSRGISIIIQYGGHCVFNSCIFSQNGHYFVEDDNHYNPSSIKFYGVTFLDNAESPSPGEKKQIIICGSLFFDSNCKKVIYDSSLWIYDNNGYLDPDSERWDKPLTDCPVSSVSFALRPGSDASKMSFIELPTGYPTVDFYGEDITKTRRMGAVQRICAEGKRLDYISNGPGMVSFVSGMADNDGMIAAGSSVTLSATPDAGNHKFCYWTVNDKRIAEKSTALTLKADSDMVVCAVFGRVVTVTTADDQVPAWVADGDGNYHEEFLSGSLRKALAQAQDNDVITFANSLAGKTITLARNYPNDDWDKSRATLPTITKNLIIEGNGITISGGNSCRIMNVGGDLPSKVFISRVHFTEGNAAIQNSANLTVQSCIFSENTGGAINNAYLGNIEVQACTFLNNVTGYETGRDILQGWKGNMLLEGNIFYGNTQGSVRNEYTVTKSWNNIFNGSQGNVFSAGNGDRQVAEIPVIASNFKLRYNSPAIGMLQALPELYPEADFYGNPITAGGNAGAVQVVTTEGYVLKFGSEGSGTVALTAGSRDADNIASGNITLTATPEIADTYFYWTVNGIRQSSNASNITLAMDEDKTVAAVFGHTGFRLDYKAVGAGSVAIANATMVNEQGLATAGTVALVATPYCSDGGHLDYWMVNGKKIAGTSTTLELAMDEDKDVQAVFKSTSNGQITLFTEDFENINDNFLSGWKFANDGIWNEWNIGNSVSHSGQNSAYSGNGISYSGTYSISGSLEHLYHDIIFSTCADAYMLSFYLNVGGQWRDELSVHLVDTAYTPVAGVMPEGQLGSFYDKSWEKITLLIPGSYYNTTKRLVFTWYNTNLFANQPPPAIDDIEIIALRNHSIEVVNLNDSGEGSLRNAINIANGMPESKITFAPALAGDTIVLNSSLEVSLPGGNRRLSIEGNGIVISGKNIQGEYPSILNIGYGNVDISRIHFTGTKGKRFYEYGGGAIVGTETVRLQSCIFSDNSRAVSGHCDVNESNFCTNISNCTFYNNETAIEGGANLRGNLFYGNSINIKNADSGGYNVFEPTADGFSGYVETDRLAGGSIFSTSSFKLLPGNDSIIAVPLSGFFIAGMPNTDFYGKPFGENGYAGAVQDVLPGHVVELKTCGAGQINCTGGSIGADNITQSTSLTLTASPQSDFLYWTVNGEKRADTGSTLVLLMNENKSVEAFFGRIVTVTNTNDSGAGSLREAIENAQDGDVITVDDALYRKTIVLESTLVNTKNITVEGNGVIISGNRLVGICDNYGTLNISRVHFKEANSPVIRTGLNTNTGEGGVIYNQGVLNVQSSIFSDCLSFWDYKELKLYVAEGSVIYNSGTATVTGCTFYNNRTCGYSLIQNNGAMTFTGNLLVGNQTKEGLTRGKIASSYNVYDADGAAFQGLGDRQLSDGKPALTKETFRVHSGSEAVGILNVLPKDYPLYDYYGAHITQGAHAGAVQGTNTGFALFLETRGETYGKIASSVTPNAFHELPASATVTLTAPPPANGKEFLFWTVNGRRVKDAVNSLEVKMDEDKRVEAVFGRKVLVTTIADAGTGSLRDAFDNLQDYDLIRFDNALAGDTIMLRSSLPVISRPVTVDANGISVDCSGYCPFNILRDVTVRLSRFRFLNKDLKFSLINNGNLIVQSCIFNNSSIARGVNLVGGNNNYIAGDLTLLGNTFYNSNVWHSYSEKFMGELMHGEYGWTGFTGKFTEEGNLYYYDNGTNGEYNSAFDGTQNVDTVGWNIRVPLDKPVPYGLNTFRLKPSGIAEKRMTMLPVGYPASDFYGETLSLPASVGAVQSVGKAGYKFITQTMGHGSLLPVFNGDTPDADNIVADGTQVQITVQPEDNRELRWWTIDGERQPNADMLNVTVDGDKALFFAFSRHVTVTTTADNATNPPAGSLREALENTEHLDVIHIADALQGDTIKLQAALPDITKEITIEGNGITISGQKRHKFVHIDEPFIENRIFGIAYEPVVTFNRVHFTGGKGITMDYTCEGCLEDLANALGNVTKTYGSLTFNSCIFSNNDDVITGRKLSVNACTFYNNRGILESFSPPGANQSLWRPGYNAAGCIFYKNDVLQYDGEKTYKYVAYTGKTGNYNMRDEQFTLSPFSPASFRLINSSSAINAIPEWNIPEDYPIVDFYGNAMRGYNLAAGAVQEKISGGNWLTYEASGPGKVKLASATMNAEGAVTSGSATISAIPDEGTGNVFRYWTVNSVRVNEPSMQITVAMDRDKTVKAVFGKNIMVDTTADNTDEDDHTSLREAINRLNASVESDGLVSVVVDTKLAGDTIVLASNLPTINRSVVIEGNGITISGDDKYQILEFSNEVHLTKYDYIYLDMDVTVRRIHFTHAYSSNYASAILYRNQYRKCRLTVQSCIFSNNISGSYTVFYDDYNGSSIFNMEACTFYNNRDGYALIDMRQYISDNWRSEISPSDYKLTGNIFLNNGRNNDWTNYSEIDVSNLSSSYNVFDRADNSAILTGTGDRLLTECPIDTISFMPAEEALQTLRNVPLDSLSKPATDFYGTERAGMTVPGAVVRAVTDITVNFDPQNGEEQFTCTYHYEEPADGFLIQEPPVPARKGYCFRAWYKEVGCSNVWNFSTDKTTQSDVTLYAQWEPYVYNISYQLNGGENHPENPATYTIEDAKIVLRDASRANHVFDSWEEGNNISSGSTGDKTFTARWRTIPVSSISLNKTELTLAVGEEETLVATILPDNATVVGIKWVSWAPSIATIENGKIRAITPGTTYVLANIVDKDGNDLYAYCFVTVIGSGSGIENAPYREAIRLFPNPARDELHIRSEQPVEKIEIYDLMGRWKMNGKPQSNESVNISSLPAGVYIVRIHTSEGVTEQKLVKE